MSIKKVLSAIFAGAMCATTAYSAENIMKEYGRNKGLCLVINSKQGNKEFVSAQIAKKSEMLVFNILSDVTTLKKLKVVMNDEKITGQLQADIASFEILPFVDNTVNLLVIEDLKIKINESEIQRVVAPEGLICKWNGTKYLFSKRKRSDGMGTWKHPFGDLGLNRKGDDKLVPLAPKLRWQDGVPVNFNTWSACRAYVINERYCFTLGSTEEENLNNLNPYKNKKDLYLSARDAYSGLPLWKINCKEIEPKSNLNANSQYPLVTNSEYVFSYKEGSVFAAKCATGEIDKLFKVAYPSNNLLLKDSILVSSGVKKVVSYGLRCPWISQVDNDGKLEVFDIITKNKLWEKNGAFKKIAIDGDKLFTLTNFWPKAPPKGKSFTPNIKTIAKVSAYDLKTGKVLWESTDASFVDEQGPSITCGSGVVVISRYNKAKGISVLSGDTGELLWEKIYESKKKKSVFWVSIIDGELWFEGKVFELKTGKKLRDSIDLVLGMCVPPTILDHLVTLGKGSKVVSRKNSKKPTVIESSRAGCVEGFAPANAMFYTPQNKCKCFPHNLPGFIALGSAPDTKAEDFLKERKIVKGDAFNKVEKANIEKNAWSILMGNIERNNKAEISVSDKLKVLWKTEAVEQRHNPLSKVWKARSKNIISAPTTGYGKIFVADIEQGKIIAVNAETGKKEWEFSAEGRIDMPPTIADGMAVFGCRNGWVYALRASDGVLVWKSFIAPMDLKLVSFGQVESLWPAPGSVLIKDGIIYATAGKTSEDNGGLAVMAFDLLTGKQKWARSVGKGFRRQNEILAFKDNSLFLRKMKINPDNGEGKIPKSKWEDSHTLAGVADSEWTNQSSKRSGNILIGGILFQIVIEKEDIVYGIMHYKGIKCLAIKKEKTKKRRPKKDRCIWMITANKSDSYTSMSLLNNNIVLGGRVIEGGKANGIVDIIDASNGKSLQKIKLNSHPVFQGIAPLNDKLFVVLNDGSIVCLGIK